MERLEHQAFSACTLDLAADVSAVIALDVSDHSHHAPPNTGYPVPVTIRNTVLSNLSVIFRIPWR